MRKQQYTPTSQQGIPEQDFARFLDIDGLGMEMAREILIAAKVAKFASSTLPAGWTFADWLKVCQNEFALLTFC